MTEPEGSTAVHKGRKRRVRTAAPAIGGTAPGAAGATPAAIAPVASVPTAPVTASDTLFRDIVIAAAVEVGADGNGADGLKGYLRKIATDDRKTYFGVLAKLIGPDLASGAEETVTRIERVIVRARE